MSERNFRIWWHNSDWSPKNWWYFIRCHTYTRYHIVNCRSPQNDYCWGYRDKDTLMFYACFSLLKDFVEKEEPFDIIDYSTCDEDKKLKQEIIDLYDWWCDGRATEQKLLEKRPDSCVYKNTTAYHEYGVHSWFTCSNARDDEMFDRLMKIRHTLWT